MPYLHKTRSRHEVSSLFGLILLMIGVASHAEPLQDGPYISQTDDGEWMARWVEGDSEAPQVRHRPVKVGDSITIAGIGEVPEFAVTLRADPAPAPDEIDVKSRAPLFVMADTHGEFAIAVQLLQRQRIIDERLRWAFGKGHLVILGDVFDRGPNQTELLWLIYKLEAEAARAGGGLHMALGNHEWMALSGDERYLNPKYIQVASALRADTFAELWNEQTLLGRWLRSKAAVFRVGDYLCLHGGVSRELIDSGLALSEINRRVRESLGARREQPDELTKLVLGRSGPMWYRGYFEQAARDGGFPVASSADVDAILTKFNVKKILVGHTVVPTVTALYEGRVIAVQVYPHRDKETQAPIMEALSIQRSKLSRARVDGSRELLQNSAAEKS